MNEVSTAAMAYAMSGFASDGLHVGTSSTNEAGLRNAALNAANLYNIQSPAQLANHATLAGNGTVPQAELHTVANILASCVDSSNTATSASATCSTLFAGATTTGTSSGTRPIDTAGAAINMSHNPGAANVVALWELSSGAVPFLPQLTAAPKDFTVAITYNNIATPGSIAIDALGNAYVPTNSSSSYVTKLSPQGAVLATSATAGSGFHSIAIDPGGNLFVTAQNSNALYAYTSTLGAVTGSPWTSPQMTQPTSVAVDSSGHVYVTNGGNSASVIQKFNNSASSKPSVSFNTSISNGCLTRVTQIAIDPSGYLWAAINSSNAVCRLTPSGGIVFSTGGQPSAPGNIAIDSQGSGWVAAGAQTNLFKFTTNGTASSYGVVNNSNQGGLASPAWVAIDGANSVWVTNTGNAYALSEFNNAGNAISGDAGYQSGTLNNPSFLAIDASGDVWVPNCSGNSVTELIGVATPVVTPLTALKPGTRP